MPINTTNSEYDAYLSKWERCRNAVDGSDAIKARGATYLPQLTGQTSDEYNAYKMRAMFYNASARTVQGLAGAVMRKEPTVEAPAVLDDHLDDVTLTGVSFSAFAKTTLEEVLKTGRYGVLVDMPAAEHETQRPYYAAYVGEAIVNWRSTVIHGVPTLTMVVLCESVRQPKPDDRFTFETTVQYRLLELNAEGNYEVQIFREEPNRKGEWVAGETLTPNYRGQPLTYIPFCFFGPNTITPEIEKPPLLDLVDVNLSHYRSSADLEHGRHFCGLPVYFFAGIAATDTIFIGSSKAITAPDPNAKAQIVEMTGVGLGALEKALETKEQIMAILGARMLEAQKKLVEAADTLSMKYAGEQSVLRSVTRTVSQGLSKLLEWTALWMGASPEEAKTATAQLNTDFTDAQMSFAELTALVGAWQSGAISYETMYYNMQRGEVTRPGIDADDEREMIAAQEPSSMPGLRVLNGND
jgi:hypothetical protein